MTNREPYSHEKIDKKINIKKSIGGVVSALDPLMQKSKGIWIAWGSGNADFRVCDSKDKVLVPEKNPKYFLKRVKLSKDEIENYYKGYANQVLWPLFHYFIEKMHPDENYWKDYYNVNKKFADAILEETNGDYRIWLHDYHLSLVPYFIKKDKPNAKIAFFWHIPWPPWEIFNILPHRDYILNGLLKSDLLGFHTQSYVNNFFGCAIKKSNVRINKEDNILYTNNNKTKVKQFPLGICYKDFAKPSKKQAIYKKAEKIKKMYNVDNLIIGIDRLDYTKGILNRIKAFEYLIKTYPKFREKVVLIQIATPSRDNVDEYQDMKKEIDETIGNINACYRTDMWTPIMYFYKRVPFRSLLSYYKAADIALLTPIRDGMNLISKEFIATKEKNGMLILSEFTGASEELNESVIVNPYDIKGTGEALKIVLKMSDKEKQKRFKILNKKVKRHDSQWWLNNFLEEWEKLYD